MNNENKQIITQVISVALDRAERHWKNGGFRIVTGNQEYAREYSVSEGMAMDKAVSSEIPGHPWVSSDETIISEFVAFVADMRDSTKHLMNAISGKTSDVSQLQRVFYETSALLPALAKTVEFEGGQVTEYLGDGVLAFFLVDETNKKEAMYKARHAALDTIGDMRNILNETLYERYSLPPLDLGVGLAMSKAIVSLIGLPSYPQPKAFGECVFRATKMSSGRNEVVIDERMWECWPTSKNGQLRFQRKVFGDGDKKVSGYLMNSK